MFTVADPDGVANSGDEIKVHFSQGNLYAKNEGSPGSPVWKWHFYNEQYQYNSNSTSLSRSISNSEKEIDLFTWGYDNTSANTSYSLNPKNTTGITGHGTEGNKQLNPSTGGDDWGVAYCGSNGIDVGTWRTLSTEEWQYLFSFSGGTNYDNDTRRGRYIYGVTVCGKTNCVVLLPDVWDETVISLADFASTTVFNDSSNPTWQEMEDAGAVCLPAAGSRNGSNVNDVGNRGFYWSSTAYDSSNAYGVGFYSSFVYPDHYGSRDAGYSVRLVTNVSAAPTPTPTEPDYVEITAKYDGEDNPARTLKWATKNLGADNETDYGKYYAWGDTEGQAAATSGTGAFATAFDWANCPFNNGSSNYDETYFNGIKNTVCPDGVLAKNHDVANKVLGGDWRMPTKEEFDALCNLTKEWKANYNNSGVNGYLFTDENDHSIFLPAAGYGGGTGRSDASGLGRYWSSSLDTSNPLKAFYLYFSGGSADTGNRSRYNGHSVRPVSDL